MEKTLSAILLCIAGMICPINTYADGEAPADFTDHTWYEYRESITEGNGSMQNPIIIRTAGQLAQLAYNVNTGAESYKNKVVALAADIDLNRTEDGQRVQWVPIGYDISHCFEGLFVGMDLKDYATNGFKAEQKHKISGVYINVSSASTVKRFGLFGCLGGNVSHLQLENVSINVDLSALNVAEYYFVGGLYGNTIDKNNNSGGSGDLWFRGSFLEQDDDYTGKYVTFATDDVAVSGSISAKGNDQAVIAVGGICGRFDNLGIIHSTANVIINTSDCMYVGGICGVNCGLYNENNGDYGNCLYDCASNVTITCHDTQERSVKVGGIAGQMEEGEKAYACVSMGSIRCTYSSTIAIHSVGGVCGYLQPGASIFACGSTMFIKSFGNVGGIVGIMKTSTNTTLSEKTKLECCSFSGHLDGSYKLIDDKGQTYETLSTNPYHNYIGGICGNLEWDDSREHITRCLLLGTITNDDYIYSDGLPSAIVGKAGTNLTSTVTYCYYDTRLFDGNAIPGSKEGEPSVKGLTTDVLISGDVNKVPWLNAGDTEPEHYGYRLEKGYYPIFYENKGHLATYYVNYTIRGYSNENLRMLFDFNAIGEVNKKSTVYVPGALLGAMPVTFAKGDCAGDFVSTMSAPTKTYNWEEKGTWRNIIMTCESFFPETEVVKVKDKTATAFNNGTCFVTTTATVRKKTVAYNRPAVIGGTKYISLNSTIDEEWFGDEATGFAGGTGTAGDPYLIKNAAQLYHAIKTNATGQFYRQLCNIIITKSFIQGANTVNNTLITEGCFSPNIPTRHNENYWKTHQCTWNANYNGDGHTVSGLYLFDYIDPAPTSEETFFSLFGNVGTYGSINNLAVVDTWIGIEQSVALHEKNNADLTTHYGIIAGKVYGAITNCIAQGINAVGRPCGGICAYVRNNGTVEDCISAVVPQTTTQDQFTPFVAYNLGSGSQGSVKNCLFVTPTMFSSADKSTGDIDAVKNCYWLKGYEPGNTGYTLEEIGEALGSRDRWTWTQDYFPTLKTFANIDIAKLMMVPVRTDKNYTFDTTTQTANNYLLGFKKMLEFEPGAAEWDNVHGSEYIEADDELGIIAPTNPMNTSASSGWARYLTSPMEAIYTSLGKSFYYIPLRTNSSVVERGISFVDPHAEAACVAAFDTDHDGRLSLQEISSVTTEKTLDAFHTTEGLQIQKFPEFRFFKSVTTLTSQLSGLNNLEEVRLPYNLQTISGDPNFTGNGNRPFSMNKITDLTIPGKVTTIEPGAFTGSEIENIYVDPFNTKFVSLEGILFDNNNALVVFPNGRLDEEIIIPGVIEEIKPGAVYDITNKLQKIFFDTTDYSTVADLNGNGIFTGDGSLVDVYISDATYGSVLYNEYLEDESWEDYADAGKLHCYYPLKIGSAKAATMYIGFDTELPEGLRSYIVESDSYPEEAKAYLKKTSNQIPNRSPIVIFADAPGTYRLFPLEEQLEPWKMFTNLLNGVGRDGMEVYQSDADRGSILTLGRNSGGTLGFFYYKGTDPIQPYRAYLTYEWLNPSKPFVLFSFLDEDITGIGNVSDNANVNNDVIYDLNGRKVADNHALPKGIYIKNGKKFVVK